VQPRVYPSIETEPVNILLVEDDDFEAAAVRRAFQKARVSNMITRATDGEDALAILENRHPEVSVKGPLIALIDLNMPRMGGLELIRKIRANPRLSNLVCFVLTTSSDEADIESAYSEHVAGYIVKETAGQDFARVLNLMSDYWLTVQMPRTPAEN